MHLGNPVSTLYAKPHRLRLKPFHRTVDERVHIVELQLILRRHDDEDVVEKPNARNHYDTLRGTRPRIERCDGAHSSITATRKRFRRANQVLQLDSNRADEGASERVGQTLAVEAVLGLGED